MFQCRIYFVNRRNNVITGNRSDNVKSVTCKANNNMTLFRGKTNEYKNLPINNSLRRSSIPVKIKNYNKRKPRVKGLVVETNIGKLTQKENLGIVSSPHYTHKSQLNNNTKSVKNMPKSKRFDFDKPLERSFHKGPHIILDMGRAQPKVLMKGENSVETVDKYLPYPEDGLCTKRTSKIEYKRMVQI